MAVAMQVLCEIWLEESSIGNLGATGYILDAESCDSLGFPNQTDITNACGNGRSSPQNDRLKVDCNFFFLF